VKRLCLVLLLFILCAEKATAQSDPFSATDQNAMGQKPFGSYDGSDFDWVDLANGGVNLRLRIASMNARGHESKYELLYSSKFWSETETYSGGGYVINWQMDKGTFGNSSGGHPNVVT
jgi:hypothetical protein